MADHPDQPGLFDWMPDPPSPRFPDGRSLAEARAQVEAALDEGVQCPCCDRLAKVYQRKLNTPMARYLIAIVRSWQAAGGGKAWVEVPGLPIWHEKVQRGDYTYLRFWNFLERRPNDDTTKRTSGFWRPTEQGVAFAREQIRAPRYVRLYNKNVLSWSEETTSIRTALGDAFDYAELWAGDL